jgi:hypothetical protein
MEDNVASRAKPSFESNEYHELKREFMRTYGETFPSEFWKEVIGLAFADNWLNKRKWSKPKLVPTPIKFTYEGVELGPETFAQPEMLVAKRKFMASHENALPSYNWKRVLTVTFDEVWKGERLDVMLNLGQGSKSM